MESSIFIEKRTRSQLTLPDDLLSRLSQRSPLKDARSALKGSEAEISKDVVMDNVDESEDEILLSPGRRPPRVTKRSVSPLPEDGHSSRSDSPPEGREHKRLKRDGSCRSPNRERQSNVHDTSTQRSTHNRSFSQPDYGKALSTFNKDVFLGKGRAQSVPIFSQSPRRIDLRNPPSSPRRPRSRSPSKERELRITSEPQPATRLDTILDEAGMQVDEAVADESNFKAPLQSLPIPHLSITSDDENTGMSQTPLLSDEPHPPVAHEGMSTPISQASFSLFMSPLTPLPETPYPSKLPPTTSRYSTVGWGIENEDKLPPLALEMQKRTSDPGLTTQSKLPRPSNTMLSPLPPVAGTSLILDASVVPPAKSPTPSNSTIPTSPRKKANAFTLMMEKAHENKEKGKGRAKGKGAAIKPSTGTDSYVRSSGGRVGRDVKMNVKGMSKETPPSKESIKSRMKPKGLSKPKLVTVSRPTVSLDTRRSPSLPPSSPIDMLGHDHERPSSASNISNIEMSADATDSETTIGQPSNMKETSVSIESLSLDPIATSPVLRAISELPLEAERHPPPVVVASLAERAGELESDHFVDSAFPEIELSKRPFTPDPIKITTIATEPLKVTEPLATESPTANENTGMPAVFNATMPESSTTTKPSTTGPSALKPPTKRVHSKRIPVAVTPRITRSSSLRQNQMSKIPGAAPKIPGKQNKLREVVPASKTSGSDAKIPRGNTPVHPSDEPADSGELQIKFGQPATEASGLLGPSRLVSPPKQSLLQSPTKSKLPKSTTSSPTKLSRSVSLHTSQPSRTLSRAFSEYSVAGSSLSTLSTALEKLHQPPPERPSTSLGFSRDDVNSSFELDASSRDDSLIASSSSKIVEKPAPPSSQGNLGKSRLVQRTLLDSSRSSGTGKSLPGTGPVMRGPGGFKVPGLPTKTPSGFFGVGGSHRMRATQKASRKTSLPSVEASPLKGGIRSGADAVDTTDDMYADLPTDPSTAKEQTLVSKEGKQRSADTLISKRVTLASQALSHSLSTLPAKETYQGSMGPPATPTRIKGVRGEDGPHSSPHSTSGQRSPSTRMSLRHPSNASKITGSGIKVTPPSRATETLQILKDCVIFVDVRTDDGDEAGSLFIEMLEGAGARILTRVGQTCTHLVFKNGMMSTLTRYRLLRDPKPLVVGIAWVVECVEQMKHVDETKFLVDLEGINISGTNKRRRSMLPKMISHEPTETNPSDVDGDVSMDGSTSSITLEDNLTPLEKARRRKAVAS